MAIRFGPMYDLDQIPRPASLRAGEHGVRLLGRWQAVVHRLGGWLQDKAYDWSPLVLDDEAVERGWAVRIDEG